MGIILSKGGERGPGNRPYKSSERGPLPPPRLSPNAQAEDTLIPTTLSTAGGGPWAPGPGVSGPKDAYG